MPLIKESNRGGGGSNEDHRTIAQFLALNTCLPDPPASAPASSLNGFGDGEWTWESTNSPEMAETPRALVPPACFPPRYPRAYASYSESARPGGGWDEPNTGQGITDLVASLKALGMPGPGPVRGFTSPPPAISARDDGSGDATWIRNRMNGSESLSHEDHRLSMLSRRSSFCGPGMSTLSRGPGNGRELHWSGMLPARTYDANAEFSSKIFLGGLPWDITEGALMHALRHFMPVKMEWPGRDVPVAPGQGLIASPRGFTYMILESEQRVRDLLATCRRDHTGWYYRLHSRKCRTKGVQVIPWAVSDANWVSCGSARLAAARTVFVGALHGMISAPALAHIMNELFTGVVYAGIDTDKNKYPIGSGRVTFDNVHSYVRAISAAYIEIHTDKFSKKVQVDPYLEDSMCSVCNVHQGPYFCREPTCFGYFCRSCWSWQHSTEEHKPLMRNSKGGPGTANGHARRSSPSELSSLPLVPNGHCYSGPNDGTPPPSTSGSGTIESTEPDWHH